jgi:predicted O-linked N-acetylglucosamine transferase (SPINDLY family)
MPQITIDQALEIAIGHHEAGRLAEAEGLYRQLLSFFPDPASGWHWMGLRACDAGRLHVAIELIGQAIRINPAVAEFHSNRGEVYRRAGQGEPAIASHHRAIELAPGQAAAHNNLGVALFHMGRPEDAIDAYRRAIALRPDFVEAHNNLGNALSDQGRLDEAIGAYRRAIALRGDYAEAFSNLGVAFKGKGWLDEAIAALRRATELNPELPEVPYNLGSSLLARGDREEADRAYRRALALRPGNVAAHSCLLTCEQYQSRVTPAALARSHAEWDARHAAGFRAGWKPWELDRNPERPLRLGFVSPDLCCHPLGHLLIRPLKNIDRRDFAVVCYSTGRTRDTLSGRIAAASNEWHEVAGLDDEALAARIRADRIDILFDLSGHTIGNRLLVFARRPAPIQITWIGYVGTTGLEAMDYLVADRFHVPPGSEHHYRERVLRLPDGYVCYDPPAEAPEVGPLPAAERGHVTFGCFNNLTKITPEVLAVWAQIVRRVPGSRLVLLSPALDSAVARQRTAAQFAAAGGDRDRLELRGTTPWGLVLKAYNTIDVALDPFPYSGGLTTCEALWMGVPVVTCPGETFASRHSLSHLTNAGLTETLAADRREYVERAVRLAGDLPHLAALRAGLRDQMARSPLCDGARFAGHLSHCLRDAWKNWCLSSI